IHVRSELSWAVVRECNYSSEAALQANKVARLCGWLVARAGVGMAWAGACSDEFNPASCPAESLALFEHGRAVLGPLAAQARRHPAGHCGDPAVIRNDQELAVTRERITYFLDLLARLRISSRPEELPLVTSGYRAEVERMQREVLDYLNQSVPPATAKVG